MRLCHICVVLFIKLNKRLYMFSTIIKNCTMNKLKYIYRTCFTIILLVETLEVDSDDFFFDVEEV